MKRHGVINETRMQDESGTVYVVQELAAVVHHPDLSGEIRATTQTRLFRTTTGLHVNFDGFLYCLPERGRKLLFPVDDANE